MFDIFAIHESFIRNAVILFKPVRFIQQIQNCFIIFLRQTVGIFSQQFMIADDFIISFALKISHVLHKRRACRRIIISGIKDKTFHADREQYA